MGKPSLTITDNRTGKTFEVPVSEGAVRAMDFRQMKTGPEDFGLMVYDPAFMNTAACKSRISYIDGDRGILNYRGYPIVQLAENASFLEVAYLLLNGELPKKPELAAWENEIRVHTFVHENVKTFIDGFRYDAHPMSVLISTIAGLSAFYPDARELTDEKSRHLQIVRLIAKMPTLAAWSYRHRLGLPFVYPDNELSYVGNFLSMIKRMAEPKYVPNKTLERALEVLFILHADHEQNCSTNVVRAVGSSGADPYTAVSAAAGALSGPLHGGANEAVLRMLREIGSKDAIPGFVKKVKAGEGRLMGFGHRVYKSYDPRAQTIKNLADQVFDVVGKNPLLEIALELERIALSDDYFISRKLYPNVDFYSGLIYESMGFPTDMFTVLFAIPRTVGWLAQWAELTRDEEQKIARPRQLYLGYDKRDFTPLDKR